MPGIPSPDKLKYSPDFVQKNFWIRACVCTRKSCTCDNLPFNFSLRSEFMTLTINWKDNFFDVYSLTYIAFWIMEYSIS